MSRKNRIWFQLTGMVIFAGLVVAFGPSLVGPLINDYIRQSELDKSLAACQPDELRFQLFYGNHGEEGGTFNFKSRRLSGGDSNSATAWSWSGQSRGPVFSEQLGGGKALSDVDTQHIKSLLASLPPPNPSASSDSYREKIHLAFYENGHLQIYHFPRDNAPPQVAELCQALGVPTHS